MSEIRRICFYGGAGAGKSTAAPRVFVDYKIKHSNIELVREFVKDWAYEGRVPESWDQLTIFGNQVYAEDSKLRRRRVDLIVTDSPILLNVSYSSYLGFEGCNELISLAKKFEDKYTSLNFFLPRKYNFKPEGRLYDEQESIKIENHIREMMIQHLPKENTYMEELSYEETLKIIKDRVGY